MNSSRNATIFCRSTAEIALGAVLLVILTIGAFVGNLLTSLIFWRRPRLRTSTNISILFLAISDVLMAVLVMPFSLASFIKGKWLFSSEACLFNAILIHALLGESLITMTCTAVIRYLCVVKPSLHQKYAKPKTVAVGISVLWFINFILPALPPLLTAGSESYSPKNIYCVYNSRNRNNVRKVLNYSGFAGAGILGLIIFLAYFKVFGFVSHHNNTVASSLQQGNPSQLEEAKITKTLVTVVLGFAACWAPVMIVYFIAIVGRYFNSHFKIPTLVYLFQTMCMFAISFINPFIYAFTSKRFRKEYFELFRSFLPSGAHIAPAEVF